MERREILNRLMLEHGLTQSGLSGMSGVRQPNISGYLSGKKPLGQDVFDRLTSCMGVIVEFQPVVTKPDLTRSELRSWKLHRYISSRFSDTDLERHRSTMLENLDRVGERSQGEPHESNLRMWRNSIEDRDWTQVRRHLTGVDRHSIEMREVTPMSGLLDDSERREVLGGAA